MRHTPVAHITSSGVSRRSALGGLAAAALGTLALAAPASAHPIRTLYIAGDSTASIKPLDVYPETGWGMGLGYYLTPHARVANHAVNGRSSKSFIDEGRLAGLLSTAASGDVLLIQFGHNDAKPDAERHTDPWGSYQDYLAQYVDAARAHGMTPVLATSIERRRFRSDGTAYSTHGDYPEAMRQLAQKKHVPLIDLQRQSLALWQQLGPERTKDYFLHTEDGRRDNTHLSEVGAAAIAQLAAIGLQGTGALSPRDLRRLDELVPHGWFERPETVPA
ncbi:rhamnogalacturonan acetylesterase [Zhihengliuella flava]|uniref:Lysophospholipase L1-like esterase n=1 Tax=Zhihengliuella flava TaxID=1285193 RepID=A0A931D4J9_9MICC|nr:rhamnogalacturonan acetylesterase [Zhihengliuella flava]MBG6084299.1 lysophospholipase L1-like esterase [Zhihengliuella flava]